MSYILDALKKSDQERRQGTLPNVLSQQSIPVSPSRAPSMWLFVLLLLLALHAGVLAWWFNPWSHRWLAPADNRQSAAQPQSDSSRTPSPVPAEPAPPPASKGAVRKAEPTVSGHEPQAREVSGATRLSRAAKTDAQPPATAAGPLEPPRREVVKKASVHTPSSVEGRESPPLAGPQSKQHMTGKDVADAAANQLKAELRKLESHSGGSSTVFQTPEAPGASTVHGGEAGVAPGGRVAASQMEGELPAKASLSASNSHEASRKSTAPSDKRPTDAKTVHATREGEDSGIPDLRQLPMSFQVQVPSMSFSMLVYAEKPAERMISINGRMVREGDEVTSGLKLERIQPDSAVFRFKGQQFLKKVF